MVRLDPTNLAILAILQDEARTTIADLARRVNRSETTVRDRVAALEANGLIRGFQALLDRPRLGHETYAQIRASCEMERIDDIAQTLANIQEVTRVELMTGDHPVLVQVLARDVHTLEESLSARLRAAGLYNLSVEVGLRTLVGQRPPPVLPAESGPVTAPLNGARVA